MRQIPDAPWIREAQVNGYPVADDDDEELETGDCPMMPEWR